VESVAAHPPDRRRSLFSQQLPECLLAIERFRAQIELLISGGVPAGEETRRGRLALGNARHQKAHCSTVASACPSCHGQ
jgi:hypothetical protein